MIKARNPTLLINVEPFFHYAINFPITFFHSLVIFFHFFINSFSFFCYFCLFPSQLFSSFPIRIILVL